MKLSIITTVYQAEKDLPRLLDSMMAVKSQDVEFFLIDNGSTDGSNAICREYAERDSRFVIHRLEDNIGYIRARNLGLDIVEADYIGFCDSDDYIDSTNYDIIMDKINDSNCDFLIAGWYTVIGENVRKNDSFATDGIYDTKKIQKMIPQFFGPSKGKKSVAGFMWKEFIRKSILDNLKIRFETDIKPYEDMLFNASLIPHIATLQIVNIPIYYYIVNPKSITADLISNFNLRERYDLQKRYFSKMSAVSVNDTCMEHLFNNALNSFLSIASKAGKKYGILRGSRELKAVFSKEDVSKQIVNSRPWEITQKIGKFLLKNRMYYFLLFLRKIRG